VCFVEPSKTLAGTVSTADRIDANASSGNVSDEVWLRRSLNRVTSSTTTILVLDEQMADKTRRTAPQVDWSAGISFEEQGGGRG